MWADTNPPPDTNWVYKKVEQEKPKGMDVFKQPPAVIKQGGRWVITPSAENLHNLDKGERYYLDLIEDGMAEDWIKVRMGMQYGFVKDGALIIDEYNEAVHCPEQAFGVDTTTPHVYVGIDFGVWSSCAFSQIDKYSRWSTFYETTVSDTNTAAFAQAVLLPKVREVQEVIPQGRCGYRHQPTVHVLRRSCWRQSFLKGAAD